MRGIRNNKKCTGILGARRRQFNLLGDYLAESVDKKELREHATELAAMLAALGLSHVKACIN